jgi:putative hydroxymethylpyrimidine transport system ATP-binding protein
VSIVIKEACLSFKDQIVFQNLDITFQMNKWTCLLGESGVGKSSLLRMVAGLNQDRVLPHTKLTATITCEQFLSLAGRVSYMTQHESLLPWLNVLDNVLLPKRLEGSNVSAYKDKAMELVQRVGLQAYVNHRPSSLSGGMRQRVALAQILLANKPIVLLDEPFSALDVINRLELQNLALEVLTGRTVIMVTHDPLEALKLSQELKILAGKPAKLVEEIKLDSAAMQDIESQGLQTYQHIIKLMSHYHNKAKL